MPVVLALTLVAATTLGAGPSQPLPPVVVEHVEPLVPGLAIDPPLATVAAPDGAVLTHRLVNGSDETLTLDLRVAAVAPGPDGRPEIGAAPPDPAWRLAAPAVTLGPSEMATLHTGVGPVASGSTAVAVVATVRGAAEGVEVAGITVLTASDGGADVAVEPPRWTRDGLRVAVGGDGRGGVVDGWVRVRSWTGQVLAEVTTDGLVVWPDVPRIIDVPAPAAIVPGPHRVDAAFARRGGGAGSAVATLWRWPPAGTAAAIALVVVPALAWAGWRRRRRSRLP